MLAALALTAPPAQAGGLPGLGGVLVQIANASDVTFSALDPMSSVRSAQNVCVFSALGDYSVTATGSGPNNAFTLTGPGGLALPYGVQWSATASAAAGVQLSAGVPLQGMSTALLSACLLGTNSATLIVTLSAADLQAAVAGVAYSGVLSLVIAPQ